MSMKHILLLSLLGVVMTTVYGQEEKPAEEKATEKTEKKEEKEEDDEDEERELSVERKEGKVTVESKEKTPTEENEYKFVFSVNGFPNLRLSFYNETKNQEAETTFKVGLMKLAEVEENSFDTPFNTTKFLYLGGTWEEWGAISYNNVTNNGSSVLTFSANKTVNGCYIQWDTYVVSRKTNISKDYHLAPNSVKFSFTVKGYTYQSTGPAKLAIVGMSFSRKEVEDDLTDKETVVMGNGEFTWDNWVMSGQKNITLTPTNETGVNKTAVVDPNDDDKEEEDEKVTLMAWVLSEKANDFVWDPKLSASQAGATSSAGTVTFSMMMIVMSVISLL